MLYNAKLMCKENLQICKVFLYLRKIKKINLYMMKKTYLTISIALISLISITDIQAQKRITEDDLTFSAHGWYGFDIEMTRPNIRTSGYMTYEAAVGFQTEPSDNCWYAQAFGYPMINIGVSWARMSNFRFYDRTRLPDLYSIFGSFERSVIRSRHFSLGYLLDFGATYNPGRYDPVGNPGNDWLSSPFMAYFGAGAFAKIHIGKRWEIGADFMFRHYSNGRLNLPNEALNALGGGVFARYRLDDYDYAKYSHQPKKIKADFKKGMQYMIAFGGGVHTCMAEWNAYVVPEEDPYKKDDIKLKKHPKFSLSFDAVYRYSQRYATGLSLDVFYSSNMKELEASDRIVYGDELVDRCPGYAPISIGVAVVQEVYWRNFAVHVAIGAYPYRHKGVNGPEAKAAGDRERGWHYERAGFRYYFPRLADTFVGFAIKSHNIKAEMLEFSVGIRL